MTTPAEPAQERRYLRKRRAILDAATTAFLRNGYLGTSMDEIAALAHASKQTLYKHFADKEGLFVEIVMSTVEEVSDPVYEAVLDLADTGDIEADLGDLGRRQLAGVMHPRLLELRRLVIAEAARFPALGQTFYDLGPGRTIAALAASFERLAKRGVLQIDDPAVAAAQFNWLLMAAPLNRAMLLGSHPIPSRAELDRHADSSVAMFLAAYRR
jgi:TetR/AcrR family transcriptional regulator, mexJK operon transcriptional repressor